MQVTGKGGMARWMVLGFRDTDQVTGLTDCWVANAAGTCQAEGYSDISKKMLAQVQARLADSNVLNSQEL